MAVGPSRSLHVDVRMVGNLGERHLAVGIIDHEGNVGVRDRVVTPSKDRLTALTRLVQRVLAATPAEQRPILCAATGPGPVDEELGGFAPIGDNDWSGLPIRDSITEVAGCPTILESTGRAYALASSEGQSAIGLHLGDDVDGGVVVGGRLLQGERGSAGAFAHLAVDVEGRPCVCGKSGCLDSYASVRGIEATTGRGLVSTPSSLITQSGMMVARACASLAAMMDIQRIRIGGVVVEAFRETFIESIRDELAERTRLTHLKHLDICVSQLHVLAGASAVALAADSSHLDTP